MEPTTRETPWTLAMEAESALQSKETPRKDLELWNARLEKAMEDWPWDWDLTKVKSFYDTSVYSDLRMATNRIKRFIFHSKIEGEINRELADAYFFLALYKKRQIDRQQTNSEKGYTEVAISLRDAIVILPEVREWACKDDETKRLMADPNFVEELDTLLGAARYLHRPVPMPAAARRKKAAAGVRVGPPVDWGDDAQDVVTLEGWFAPEPDFLDVAMLRLAIDRAQSVCRLEIGGYPRATGVLVGERLVLTNAHAIGGNKVLQNADLLKHITGQTKIRFGAFTAENAATKAEQEVALDAAKPVVACSLVECHDYLLLQLADGIAWLKDLKAVPYRADLLAPQSALHILQHPKGGGMKLALSANGVRSVLPERGMVHYVTRTAGGSSGAPCFDQDWNMVALHHAEIARSFGAIREGILLSTILPKIQGFLQS